MIEELRNNPQKNPVSDRKFGYSIAIVFFILSVGAWRYNWFSPVYTLVVAALFLVVAMWLPKWLKPLNFLWYHVGRILQFLISPIILGIMFFIVLLPIAVVRRMRGKGPIKKQFDLAEKSYWIERNTMVQRDIFDHIF